MRKAVQLGIPYEDPGEFEYSPGKGIVATSDGDEIIVGNWHFLQERRVQCEQSTNSEWGSEIFVARGGRFPRNVCKLQTRSDPRRKARFNL